MEATHRTIARGADPSFRGSGAGGGIAFTLAAFCGAEIVSGFSLVAEASLLTSCIQSADVVITGEGKLPSSLIREALYPRMLRQVLVSR